MTAAAKIVSVRDRLLRKRNLAHPTSRNFAEQPWRDLLKEGTALDEDDLRLIEAALFFGRELQSLRKSIYLTGGSWTDKSFGVAIAVAVANISLQNLRTQFRSNVRKSARSSDMSHLTLVGHTPVRGGYSGNEATADTMVASIVDSIPHSIEHILSLKEGTLRAADIAAESFKLLRLSNIESSLRDLWQQVVWEGWSTREYKHQPTDRGLASRWNAWTWRQEQLYGQSATLESLRARATRNSGVSAERMAVIGVRGRVGEKRTFRVGLQSAATAEQNWHSTERKILEECYLSANIDSLLPSIGVNLSCRMLHDVWCVLRDCANALQRRIETRRLGSAQDVFAFALSVDMAEVHRAVRECTSLSSRQVSAALRFLTADLGDVSALFRKGLWARPIVPISRDGVDGQAVLVNAAISVGSVVRRLEDWLERGGLSDHLGDARRGLRFEAGVRKELRERVEENRLLTSCEVAPDAIPAQSGEQIDLLLKLRDTIYVGEVKCLIAPIESIERHNYLRKLSDASEQARRKVEFIIENRHLLVDIFKLKGTDVNDLSFTPLVIIPGNRVRSQD